MKKEKILSINNNNKLTNVITLELDKHLIFESNLSLKNYIYNEKFKDSYAIRYPGATRGHIKVDENNIITEIKIYHDKYRTDKIYKDTIDKALEKFIGFEFVV